MDNQISISLILLFTFLFLLIKYGIQFFIYRYRHNKLVENLRYFSKLANNNGFYLYFIKPDKFNLTAVKDAGERDDRYPTAILGVTEIWKILKNLTLGKWSREYVIQKFFEKPPVDWETKAKDHQSKDHQSKKGFPFD